MQDNEDFFFESLDPSRKRRKVGDVFTMKTPLGYLLGRVISTEAIWSSDPSARANLLYIYRPLLSKEPTLADAEGLAPDDLLIAPIMTNNQGWLQGYFKTIGNVPIEQASTLGLHCFYHESTDTYWDERGNELAGSVGLVGMARLASHGSIAFRIQKALTR